jgi:hypothetical protein
MSPFTATELAIADILAKLDVVSTDNIRECVKDDTFMNPYERFDDSEGF